jgi:hypothetical protein
VCATAACEEKLVEQKHVRTRVSLQYVYSPEVKKQYVYSPEACSSVYSMSIAQKHVRRWVGVEEAL